MAGARGVRGRAREGKGRRDQPVVHGLREILRGLVSRLEPRRTEQMQTAATAHLAEGGGHAAHIAAEGTGRNEELAHDG